MWVHAGTQQPCCHASAPRTATRIPEDQHNSDVRGLALASVARVLRRAGQAAHDHATCGAFHTCLRGACAGSIKPEQSLTSASEPA